MTHQPFVFTLQDEESDGEAEAGAEQGPALVDGMADDGHARGAQLVNHLLHATQACSADLPI